MKCPECKGPTRVLTDQETGVRFNRLGKWHEHLSLTVTRKCARDHSCTYVRRLGCRVPGCDWTEEPEEHTLREVSIAPPEVLTFGQRLRRRLA